MGNEPLSRTTLLLLTITAAGIMQSCAKNSQQKPENRQTTQRPIEDDVANPTRPAQPTLDAAPPTRAVRESIPADGPTTAQPLLYSTDSKRLLGHFVQHADPGTAPILVILHDDTFGLDDFITKRARDYANLGYHVVCPDLSQLGSTPSDEAVVANVRAAMKKAESELKRDPVNRFAIMGWDSGATHAFTAARYLEFDLLIVAYGQLSTDPEQLRGLREPILGIYGQQDPFITPQLVTRFREIFAPMGGRFEANIWKDEGHDFMRFPSDPANVKEADVEILRWLDASFPPS